MKKKPKLESASGAKAHVTSGAENPDYTEYNFVAVGPLELDACCFYEFARESPGIIEVVGRLRQAEAAVQAAHPGATVWPEPRFDYLESGDTSRPHCNVGFLVAGIQEEFGEQEVSFSGPRQRDPEQFLAAVLALAKMAEFPERPWQRIKAQDSKQTLVQAVKQEWSSPPPFILYKPPEDATFDSATLNSATFNKFVLAAFNKFFLKIQSYFQETAGSGESFFGFFRLDLKGDDNAIHEGLDAFLRVQRERAGITPPEKKGGRAETLRTRLNQLGALRLRGSPKGKTLEQATATLGQYPGRKEYGQACKEALQHFEDYFALSDDNVQSTTQQASDARSADGGDGAERWRGDLTSNFPPHFARSDRRYPACVNNTQSPNRGLKPQPKPVAFRPELATATIKHLHSKEEVALGMDVSARTVENWMAQKRIPFLRLSPRMVKFNMERVLAALNRYEVREAGRRAA